MKSTFKIIFYLKRDKIKQNGKAPVFCRITINGAVTRFSFKAEINPSHWNIDFARATGKSKEAVDINQRLESTSASLHAIYRKILEKDNYVTAEKVKNSFLGLSTDSTTLQQLYQQHNDDMEKSVVITVVTSNTYINLHSDLLINQSRIHSLVNKSTKGIVFNSFLNKYRKI